MDPEPSAASRPVRLHVPVRQLDQSVMDWEAGDHTELGNAADQSKAEEDTRAACRMTAVS